LIKYKVIDFFTGERKQRLKGGDYSITKKNYIYMSYPYKLKILLLKKCKFYYNKQTQIKFHFSIKSLNSWIS
jgi:hypothetical protein